VARDLELEQSALRNDMEAVRYYGAAHPDAWVGVRFENEPTVRIVALFAGDEVASHRDALRRLVSFPDRLEVRSSPWPLVRLEQITDEIRAMATAAGPGDLGVFSGWGGTAGGKVGVRLRGDGEGVAAQLVERFGDAVDITVGFLRFPGRVFPVSTEPRFAAADRPRPPLLRSHLSLTAVGDLMVRSGADLWSTARLSNDGSAEVVVKTNGQLTPVVVDPQTDEVVGAFSGVQTLPLVRFAAPAAGSVEIPLRIGTASTVPMLGYAVPPGRWAVEVALALGDGGVFRAPPLPLTVTA
jgi:hypothetical protein